MKAKPRWLPSDVRRWWEEEIARETEAIQRAQSSAAEMHKCAEEMRGYGENELAEWYDGMYRADQEREASFVARRQRIRDYLDGKIPLDDV